MTKVIRKNASRVGNKANKKTNLIRTRSLIVVHEDYRDVLSVDPYAQNLMGGVEGKVSPELLDLLNEMLLGFCDDMQAVMANDLRDFTKYHVIKKTGCLAVDSVLGACYTWIAEEQDIDLKEILKLMTNSKKH